MISTSNIIGVGANTLQSFEIGEKNAEKRLITFLCFLETPKNLSLGTIASELEQFAAEHHRTPFFFFTVAMMKLSSANVFQFRMRDNSVNFPSLKILLPPLNNAVLSFYYRRQRGTRVLCKFSVCGNNMKTTKMFLNKLFKITFPGRIF